jgi:Alternative oxidase
MKQIAIARRDIRTWSDWTAFNLVRFLRWSTDLATGYRHQKELKKLEENPKADRFAMTERKWMIRFIFLESVAGVPGIVGGMLRHLRSLRRMQRDNGWFVEFSENFPKADS